MAAFGIVALLLMKLGLETTPLVLGFVLGDALEANFRRALILADGDWSTFVRSPLAVILLLTAALLVAVTLLPRLRRSRNEIFQEPAP